MFEKLLGSINHLAHHHAIFLAFSGGFNFLSITQSATPTFLGCWTLIVLAFVTHFQQDDHLILLDVVAHVKIGISPF